MEKNDATEGSAAAAKPFLKFKTRPAHYIADACVVWCFDDRFYKLLKKFGKKRKFAHIDLVKVAGGAKALAIPADQASPERDFVMNQVKASVRLHSAKRVVLMLHRDCGTYGGSKAFAGATEERAYYMNELRAAREFTRKELPAMLVEAVFADFDGLYFID